MTNPEDLNHLAAAVISEARQMSGLTNPEFDYDISIHGVGGPLGPLGNACYRIATRHLPPVQAGTPESVINERQALATQLWNDLQLELAAYAQRCRNRQYTGWSNTNPNPIRYAS